MAGHVAPREILKTGSRGPIGPVVHGTVGLSLAAGIVLLSMAPATGAVPLRTRPIPRTPPGWPATMHHGSVRTPVVYGGTIFSPPPAVKIETPGSGVEITVRQCYGYPRAGFLPLRVSIRNQSGDTRRWRVESRSEPRRGTGGSFPTFSEELEVESGASREFELLIPVPLQASSSGCRLEVSGYGVVSNPIYLHAQQTSPSPKTRSGTFQNALGVSDRLVEAFGEVMKTHRIGVWTFDPSSLPSDWRGLLGLEGRVVMLDEEWMTLAPGVRKAVGEWVVRGGELFVVCRMRSAGALAALRLPGGHQDTGGSGKWAYGFGRVQAVEGNGTVIDPAALRLFVEASREDVADLLRKGYPKESTLAQSVGELKIKVTAFLIFLLGFAIVVGPLNFFVISRGPRRMRLLWTTPLISLAVGGLLAVFILVREGTGGTGFRWSAVMLVPSEEAIQEVVVQEQASRTGALWKNAFESKDPLWLQPLMIQTSGARLVYGRVTRGGSEYSDWLMSRAIQAHYVETVRPTRARIECFPGLHGEAPTVLSSVGASLETLFLIDERGGYWKVDQVGPGARHQLTASSSEAYRIWWNEVCQQAGPALEYLLAQVGGRPGYFYSVPSVFPGIATSPAIIWKQAGMVLMGPWKFQSDSGRKTGEPGS